MERQRSDHSLVEVLGPPRLTGRRRPTTLPPSEAAATAMDPDARLLEALRTAVAEAARGAVEAAFAELGPALFRAIPQLSAEPQGGDVRSPPLLSPPLCSPPLRSPPIPRRGPKPRTSWRRSDHEGRYAIGPRQGSFEDVPVRPLSQSERTDHSCENSSEGRASSGPSVFSVLTSPVLTMYSLGRSTIHSLHAESGHSSCMRGPSSSASGANSRHESPRRQASRDRRDAHRELNDALCAALSQIADDVSECAEELPRQRNGRPALQRRRSAPSVGDGPTPGQLPGVFQDMPPLMTLPPRSEGTDLNSATALAKPCLRRASTTPLAGCSAAQPGVHTMQADTAMLVHSPWCGTITWPPQRRSEHEGRKREASEARGRAARECHIMPRVSLSPSCSATSPGRPLPNQVELETSEDRITPRVTPNLTDGQSPSCSGILTPFSSAKHISSQVLQACVDELAQEAGEAQEAKGAEEASEEDSRASTVIMAAPVSTVLCTVGLLRWDSRRFAWLAVVYQWLMRASILLAAAASLLAPPSAEDFSVGCDAGACWRQAGLLRRLPLAAGAVLALLPLRLRSQQERLQQTLSLVQAVHSKGWEATQQRWDAATFLLLWLGVVVVEGAGGGAAAGQAAQTFLTAISSGAVLCLAYSIVYIGRSLATMVDTFSRNSVGSLPLDKVAYDWTLAQSVLRKAAADVEQCLLALLAVLAVALPILALDMALPGESGARLPLPGAIVAIGAVRALFVAARVSEACGRLPALINAMHFGPGTERARQHTVDYIASSAAGLYVFDTRLTTSAVLKTAYLVCVVTVAAWAGAAEP